MDEQLRLRWWFERKRAVRGGERTCRESLVERPCVKEKDTELCVITAFGEAEGACVWERRLSVGERSF